MSSACSAAALLLLGFTLGEPPFGLTVVAAARVQASSLEDTSGPTGTSVRAGTSAPADASASADALGTDSADLQCSRRPPTDRPSASSVTAPPTAPAAAPTTAPKHGSASAKATSTEAALTRAEAEDVRRSAWAAYEKAEREGRAKEIASGVVNAGGTSMRFFHVVRGEKPEHGRSLYISMHGGGGAPAQVNDQQWENQKALYTPPEGVYVAPRAPGNTWDLWHQAHIDPLFDRLIADFVVAGEVDPNRVYLLGYSAGGDGVFQLAPRMADRFAAAAMMAGHPNETKPDGLRNLPFTIHMGEKDSAFKRNEIAAQWKVMLDDLERGERDAGRPGAYPHEVVIHAGKGHWMDRNDRVALAWMARFSRELRPKRIVWLQDDVTDRRFYWLGNDAPKAGARVEVEREGQTIRVVSSKGVTKLRIRLDDSMLELDKEVTVEVAGRQAFRGIVPRSRAVIETTLAERGDPTTVFVGEIEVTLPEAL
jgi:poly(3-hydroxybutyrate) depolymerase